MSSIIITALFCLQTNMLSSLSHWTSQPSWIHNVVISTTDANSVSPCELSMTWRFLFNHNKFWTNFPPIIVVIPKASYFSVVTFLMNWLKNNRKLLFAKLLFSCDVIATKSLKTSKHAMHFLLQQSQKKLLSFGLVNTAFL